jgi:hypothetical protein
VMCATWPAAAAQDRYAGPWNRPTAGTILVMGNTGDPITSYQSSVAMSRDLAKARLLTIRGYGHTEYNNPSTCATNYEINYLLTGNPPPVGTTCPQNAVPFPSRLVKKAGQAGTLGPTSAPETTATGATSAQ